MSLGIAARWLFDAPSEAWHLKRPDGGYEHIGSINSYEADGFCTEMLDASMSDAEFYGRVTYALWGPSPYVLTGWHGMNVGKVHFFSMGACVFAADERIRFWGESDWVWAPDGCQDEWVGCEVTSEDTYYDPTSGHEERPFSEIWLKTGALTPEYYEHLINHEVGHSLGMKDGGPEADGTACVNEHGYASIMHTYGCPLDLRLPSPADKATIEDHIPDAASSPNVGKSTGVGGFTW